MTPTGSKSTEKDGDPDFCCLSRLEAHWPVLHSHGPWDMWRHRAEVRVQPRHQEVSGLCLQWLWGEWEQLQFPQKLHCQVQQRPKGYDCKIIVRNVHFTVFWWKKLKKLCVTLFRCSSQEDHSNKEKKHRLHTKPPNLKAVNLSSHLYLCLYFMFFSFTVFF